MSTDNELLPEWLNNFLDEVETSLCLPILIIIIFCTAQIILHHTVDIGYTFYQTFKPKDDDDAEECRDCFGLSMTDKLKGLYQGLVSIIKPSKAECGAHSQDCRNAQEEEWDYCEDDED